MGLNDIHIILFNAYILFSAFLGVWAIIIGVRNQPISGNFWGSVATNTLLAAATTVVGFIMTLQGLRPPDGRLTLYFLYMAFLVVIMPGLFSILRGRDDQNAAYSFAFLALFNAAVALSLTQRLVAGGWVPA